jgi:hypothetical protein
VSEHPSKGGEADKTVFVHVGDDQPNLIHMARQHYLHALWAGLAFACNQVAQGIDAYLVDQWRDFRADQSRTFPSYPDGPGVSTNFWMSSFIISPQLKV